MREEEPIIYAVTGAVILLPYGIIPTFHQAPMAEFMLRMAACLTCCHFSGEGASMARGRWSGHLPRGYDRDDVCVPFMM